MCRLFGLSAGSQRVEATFWLLNAPDSLEHQSRYNPDGTGLGTFDSDGHALVEKAPIAAYDDSSFAAEARVRESSTFVAHVRRSSGTPLKLENTHPFASTITLDGHTTECLFAHNGVVGHLPTLEAHVGVDMDRVHGDTDSERWFALICREIEACGDVVAGIRTAACWVQENLPVLSANFVLTTPSELYAFRYPDTHELYLLDRSSSADGLAGRSAMGTRIDSAHLAQAPAVLVASEPLDDDDWQLIAPGELVTVDRSLRIDRATLLTPPGTLGGLGDAVS